MNFGIELCERLVWFPISKQQSQDYEIFLAELTICLKKEISSSEQHRAINSFFLQKKDTLASLDHLSWAQSKSLVFYSYITGLIEDNILNDTQVIELTHDLLRLLNQQELRLKNHQDAVLGEESCPKTLCLSSIDLFFNSGSYLYALAFNYREKKSLLKDPFLSQLREEESKIFECLDDPVPLPYWSLALVNLEHAANRLYCEQVKQSRHLHLSSYQHPLLKKTLIEIQYRESSVQDLKAKAYWQEELYALKHLGPLIYEQVHRPKSLLDCLQHSKLSQYCLHDNIDSIHKWRWNDLEKMAQDIEAVQWLTELLESPLVSLQWNAPYHQENFLENYMKKAWALAKKIGSPGIFMAMMNFVHQEKTWDFSCACPELLTQLMLSVVQDRDFFSKPTYYLWLHSISSMVLKKDLFLFNEDKLSLFVFKTLSYGFEALAEPEAKLSASSSLPRIKEIEHFIFVSQKLWNYIQRKQSCEKNALIALDLLGVQAGFPYQNQISQPILLLCQQQYAPYLIVEKILEYAQSRPLNLESVFFMLIRSKIAPPQSWDDLIRYLSANELKSFELFLKEIPSPLSTDEIKFLMKVGINTDPQLSLFWTHSAVYSKKELHSLALVYLECLEPLSDDQFIFYLDAFLRSPLGQDLCQMSDPFSDFLQTLLLSQFDTSRWFRVMALVKEHNVAFKDYKTASFFWKERFFSVDLVEKSVLSLELGESYNTKKIMIDHDLFEWWLIAQQWTIALDYWRSHPALRLSSLAADILLALAEQPLYQSMLVQTVLEVWAYHINSDDHQFWRYGYSQSSTWIAAFYQRLSPSLQKIFFSTAKDFYKNLDEEVFLTLNELNLDEHIALLRVYFPHDPGFLTQSEPDFFSFRFFRKLNYSETLESFAHRCAKRKIYPFSDQERLIELYQERLQSNPDFYSTITTRRSKEVKEMWSLLLHYDLADYAQVNQHWTFLISCIPLKTLWSYVARKKISSINYKKLISQVKTHFDLMVYEGKDESWNGQKTQHYVEMLIATVDIEYRLVDETKIFLPAVEQILTSKIMMRLLSLAFENPYFVRQFFETTDLENHPSKLSHFLKELFCRFSTPNLIETTFGVKNRNVQLHTLFWDYATSWNLSSALIQQAAPYWARFPFFKRKAAELVFAQAELAAQLILIQTYKRYHLDHIILQAWRSGNFPTPVEGKKLLLELMSFHPRLLFKSYQRPTLLRYGLEYCDIHAHECLERLNSWTLWQDLLMLTPELEVQIDLLTVNLETLLVWVQLYSHFAKQDIKQDFDEYVLLEIKQILNISKRDNLQALRSKLLRTCQEYGMDMESCSDENPNTSLIFSAQGAQKILCFQQNGLKNPPNLNLSVQEYTPPFSLGTL